MDAFNQADAISQMCSGLFGIAAVGFFIYFALFRKKKEKK